NTDANGNFTLTGVPEGNFILDSHLNTRDFAQITGFASANQTLTNQNITIVINDNTFGTVNGKVIFPDGSPAGGVVVYGEQGGVLSNADGSYSLPGFAIRQGSQAINAATRDGRRSGTAPVLINSPGKVINGVIITLSG